MGCSCHHREGEQQLVLISKICDLYEKISSLTSLHPSKDVDTLFSELVLTCIPPSSIDVTKLTPKLQQTRSNLIKLCAQAEGLLESHYSTLLSSSHQNPLHHLSLFPYFSNYLKLADLEAGLLSQHSTRVPARLAFVGSGPLPLTSIVLASHHLPTTAFHNYDIDPAANAMACRLIEADSDLSGRMFFHTSDIMDVSHGLKECEVVFLAALVGMDKEEKGRFVDHLAKHMAPGAILMLRSAHGARAFLYPVVDPCELRGFEVLSVYHPTDEVINSVIIARKLSNPNASLGHHHHHHRHHHHHHQKDGLGMGCSVALPCKCSDELQGFGSLCHGHKLEELAIEE